MSKVKSREGYTSIDGWTVLLVDKDSRERIALGAPGESGSLDRTFVCSRRQAREWLAKAKPHGLRGRAVRARLSLEVLETR